jgi:hypothetical protein
MTILVRSLIGLFSLMLAIIEKGRRAAEPEVLRRRSANLCAEGRLRRWMRRMAPRNTQEILDGARTWRAV